MRKTSYLLRAKSRQCNCGLLDSGSPKRLQILALSHVTLIANQANDKRSQNSWKVNFRTHQVLETTYLSPAFHEILFYTQLSGRTHCHKLLQKPEAKAASSTNYRNSLSMGSRGAIKNISTLQLSRFLACRFLKAEKIDCKGSVILSFLSLRPATR